MDKRSGKKLILLALIFVSVTFAFSLCAIADELKESEQARAIFRESLKMFTNEDTIPTFQGHRSVTVVKPDGMRHNFGIFDGFCNKYGGYKAKVDNIPDGKEQRDQMRMPPPNGAGRPHGGPGGPPGGKGGPGGPGGMGGPGNPPGGMMERRPDQFDPLESLKRLLVFNRPDMEPVFGDHLMVGEKLLADDSHLMFKGPVASEVAGRKTWLIEVSARNYKGNFLRIWIDRETKVPLKKERIDSTGKIRYLTEYDRIEYVDDEKFRLKNNEDTKPDIFGPGGKPIPAEMFEKRINVDPPSLKRVEGFDMLSMRRMPVERFPGMHYVFTDGLNTISIFYFDTTSIADKDKVSRLAQKLGERLDSILPYPVLMKQDKDNEGFVLITSDMEKPDLKRITALIATHNFEELKRFHKEKQEKMRKLNFEENQTKRRERIKNERERRSGEENERGN
ncbi:MAG: hypothetical protein ABIG42_08805 [bacterium]